MTDARTDGRGRVEAIWTSPEEGEPMESTESVEAVEGGLHGDRYLLGTGYYSPYDVCQVTFVSASAIEEIREETGIDLSDGRHRRNVVVSVSDLRALLETTFRIGEAAFRGTRPRPPCAHVERVAGEEGVARALGDGRGGICADVVTPGTVRVGDELEVVEADPRTEGRSIIDRLRGDGDDGSQ
ncbi:MOSC domain-containing protein [Halopelagius longus]|uniref:MOSC domain-containing protein n=1 Tax=Halopelagius longus TaxID=1236180 RepID=A0A1H1AR55_9EURY|nr:MOSC domain-containing protein [Halopelagius longus]RDI70486.1 MOSC domain-containing protein [Halopelagius longus]SDQ42205.1 MOSC domain-containing protein [Halopelagius longus]